LAAVVAIGVLGRVSSPSTARPSASTVAQAASPEPIVAAAPTPSRRSDWPAAIGRRSTAPTGTPRPDREEGTDGLMGGIPFGIPGDTPYPRRDAVNRFTIDDLVVTATRRDTTPPWVRRTGGLPTYVTDPAAG
jgi:hypothetical protein